MTDNQLFKDLTNFLKDQGIVKSFGEIAVKVGISRSDIDNMRFGGKKVPTDVLDRIRAAYPETLHIYDKIKEDDNIELELIDTQKNLIQLQRKVINRHEATEEELKNENEILKQEIERLTEIIRNAKS